MPYALYSAVSFKATRAFLNSVPKGYCDILNVIKQSVLGSHKK